MARQTAAVHGPDREQPAIGATLVTANIKEFRRVEGLSCLEWTG